MAGTKGCDAVRWSESLLKPVSSSDRGSQLDPVKSESLVIADQQRCGEYVPGLVHTARHVMKVGNTEAGGLTVWEEPSKVGSAIGTKSVTR